MWETRRFEIHRQLIKKRKMRGGLKNMNNVIQNFIGKECLIYNYDSQVSGTIERLEDNWLVVNVNGRSEIHNLDFIKRICEKPHRDRNKKR